MASLRGFLRCHPARALPPGAVVVAGCAAVQHWPRALPAEAPLWLAVAAVSCLLLRTPAAGWCLGRLPGTRRLRRGVAQPLPVGMLLLLANMETPPESVPINALVPIRGTPLGNSHAVEGIEFVRTIAAARITMPRAKVRLSAGREAMSDELQALCFLAGANSIFYGERLLTTGNPEAERDRALFERLGLHGEGTA